MGVSKPSSRYHFLPKLLLFLFFLYLFFASIDLMESAFRGFGRGFAERLIATTANPFVGLFIGLLCTSIVQSSSLTTSILVGMVAAGTISIRNSIPVVMGANIGTTVTNMLVAMTHITRKQEFRKAFAAATVHDFFNILSVLVFLPLQLLSQFIFGEGFLQFLSTGLADIFENVGGTKLANPLKIITSPITKLLHDHLFPALLGPFFGPQTGEKLELAVLTFLFALGLLFLALMYMAKTMRSAVMVKVESLFDTYLFKTAIRSFALGLILTATIQSSSVTTSLIVPLTGAGILTVEQIFPYTLGANIGTTVTAILASLTTGNIVAVTVAFSHMFFNICGTIVWYPLRIVPITLAQKLGDFSAKSRTLAIIYIVVIFYVIPGLVIFLAR